ncbi:MAG: CapA family protein [Coriobacteriia bacterium]|nr:CapA family protein [Coriobacteriia bacterium]
MEHLSASQSAPHPTRGATARARAQARRHRILATGAVVLVLAALAVAGVAAGRSMRAQDAATLTRAVTPRPAPLPSVDASSVLAHASRPATLTVAAVGDMIFDRRVASLIAASGGRAPLARVASLLSRADITVGNLESPLSSRGSRNLEKDVTFRGDPRGVEGLAAAGFDFLSLANNHVLDYGPDALADTVALLDQHGIGHAGAGADRSAAWRPAAAERNGARVAFLSFSHILPAGFVATDSKAGLARGRGNMDAVCEAIRQAKSENDYVIVSFHWGVEYQDDCNAEQVRDAHAAIDAGADMVLSHHPHVIQAVERYKGRLIAYSLGDFVFDHYSRKTGEAFVLQAELGPDGVGAVRIVPVYLDVNGRPEVVTGEAARVILERLRAISAKHGTTVVLHGDEAEVAP